MENQVYTPRPTRSGGEFHLQVIADQGDRVAQPVVGEHRRRGHFPGGGQFQPAGRRRAHRVACYIHDRQTLPALPLVKPHVQSQPVGAGGVWGHRDEHLVGENLPGPPEGGWVVAQARVGISLAYLRPSSPEQLREEDVIRWGLPQHLPVEGDP